MCPLIGNPGFQSCEEANVVQCGRAEDVGSSGYGADMSRFRLVPTRLLAGSRRSRLHSRRNVAPRAGTSHPETARAKRYSSVKPATLDGATLTLTLHAISPPDGR